MQNIFEKSQTPIKKETESPEIERWKAPTFEELKAQKNDFRDHRADIHGLLKAMLLERIEKGYISVTDVKYFFQSLELSDQSTFLFDEDLSFIKSEMFRRPREGEISPQEKERHLNAFQKSRSIPICKRDQQDFDGFFPTPKFQTDRSGIFFTNAYRNQENLNGKLMNLESIDYRVNFGCSYDISNIRVEMDLFELLKSNSVLAEKGFRIKSLGNNRTDAVIVYCGKKGVAAVLEEVVNYCLKEGIDSSEQGVPLGVKPRDKNGIKMRRISVTSSPHGGYTFNDLQSHVFLNAFVCVVNKFFKNNVDNKFNFDNASSEDLFKLMPEIKKRDSDLFLEMEKEYEIALREICKTDTVNMHNLAFPFVKNKN